MFANAKMSSSMSAKSIPGKKSGKPIKKRPGNLVRKVDLLRFLRHNNVAMNVIKDWNLLSHVQKKTDRFLLDLEVKILLSSGSMARIRSTFNLTQI